MAAGTRNSERYNMSKKNQRAKSGPQFARKRGSRSIQKPPRSVGATCRPRTPTVLIQIYRRNASRLDESISPDDQGVASGSTLGIYQTKSATRFGKDISPNWHSLQARSVAQVDGSGA